MAHVAGVTAVQIGYPVAVFVLVEAGDGSFHFARRFPRKGASRVDGKDVLTIYSLPCH